jgi:hypothetical protein
MKKICDDNLTDIDLKSLILRFIDRGLRDYSDKVVCHKATYAAIIEAKKLNFDLTLSNLKSKGPNKKLFIKDHNPTISQTKNKILKSNSIEEIELIINNMVNNGIINITKIEDKILTDRKYRDNRPEDVYEYLALEYNNGYFKIMDI